MWKRDVCVLRGNGKVPGEVLRPEFCVRWEWGRPGLGPRGQGQCPGRGGDGYLAGEGFRERLPVRAERAGRVVQQEVLQPRVGAVLAQHHVAPVPQLGQQEVAAASPAPGGTNQDQICSLFLARTPAPGVISIRPSARVSHP